MLRHNKTQPRMTALAIGAALVIAACGAQSTGGDTTAAPAADTTSSTEGAVETTDVEAFDLDALIAAAQEEGELTVYDGSGRITNAGEEFEELYGIVVNGQKASNVEQVELVTREADSGNQQASLVQLQDGPSIEAVLLAEGYVESWVPPDMVEGLAEEYRDPLQILYSARVFGYNTEIHGDICPVSNVWELTEEDWRGRIQMSDPLAFPETLDWFSKIIADESDTLEQAYEELYGEALVTEEENAGWEWVKRFAQNDAVIRPDDQDIIEAVGAPGQESPPFGFYHLSKLRDIEEAGLQVKICENLAPWLGYAYPKYSLIVSGGPSPNAARLFSRWMLTEEGSANWVRDAVGNFSTHADVPPNADDPIGGIDDWMGTTLFLGPDHNQTAWEMRQDVQDFWLANRG